MFTAAVVTLTALALAAIIAGLSMRKPARPAIDCTNAVSRNDYNTNGQRMPGLNR